VLQYTKLEVVTRDKHSSLSDPIVSNEEIKVLWQQLMCLFSQHIIFYVTYEWDQYDRVFDYIRLEVLIRDKHSSLSDPIVN
jgi:hypothetical protein